MSELEQLAQKYIETTNTKWEIIETLFEDIKKDQQSIKVILAELLNN